MRIRLHPAVFVLCLLSVLSGCRQTGQDDHPIPTENANQTRSLQAHMSAMHRGHKWIRSHPFTIMGLTRMTPKPFEIDKYRGAGFNTLLAWEPGTFEQILPIASANQMPYHVNFERWGDEQTNRSDSNEQTLREALAELDTPKNRDYIQNQILNNPGCIGWLVNDEATRSTYLRYTRHMLKWLRHLHPEALAYCNARPEGEFLIGPDYQRYIDDFAAIIDPDVLMVDIYPFGDLETVDGWVHAECYFFTLEVVRRVALQQGMPYWLFIQSFETHNGWHRRLPSESDLRFQLFAPLTYGYTGIAYFTYDLAFERALIEKTGQPNRLYYQASEANSEVANLGTTLRFLTSTDVRFVPGHSGQRDSLAANSVPRGATAWSPGAGGDGKITDVEVDSPGQWKDGLLGFFQDDHGDQYFMLTNLWHGKNGSAEDHALAFAIKFAPEVKKLYRLNRLSGSAETVPLAGGKLTVQLPGGTGDLFKYSTKPFPNSTSTGRK